MTWVFFGLLGAGIFGVLQIVDKVVLSKYEVPPTSYLVILGLAALPGAAFVYFLGIEPCPPRLAALGILNGAMFFLFVGGFFFTLVRVDTPVASALFYLKLVFVGLWGLLLFHEVFSVVRYIGIALIIFVALGLAFVGREAGKKAILSPLTFFVVIAATFLGSIVNALAKYGLSQVDTATWFFYERLGALPALALLLSIGTVRRTAFRSLRLLGPMLLAIFAAEFAGLGAIFCMLTAYSLGPLTLVAVLAATIPLYTTAYILVINSIFPGLIPDTATHTHWKERTLLIFAGMAGIYLTVSGG